MVNSKEICAFFYDVLGSGGYVCRGCGTTRKQQIDSSYTNLMSHITTEHPQYNCNNAAILAKFTDLQPVKRIVTR